MSCLGVSEFMLLPRGKDLWKINFKAPSSIHLCLGIVKLLVVIACRGHLSLGKGGEEKGPAPHPFLTVSFAFSTAFFVSSGFILLEYKLSSPSIAGWKAVF